MKTPVPVDTRISRQAPVRVLEGELLGQRATPGQPENVNRAVDADLCQETTEYGSQVGKAVGQR
jgi:hypothetical protein